MNDFEEVKKTTEDQMVQAIFQATQDDVCDEQTAKEIARFVLKEFYMVKNADELQQCVTTIVERWPFMQAISLPLMKTKTTNDDAVKLKEVQQKLQQLLVNH